MQWRILDPAFPDELPQDEQKMYTAIIGGADGEKSSKVFREVTIRQFQGENWLSIWYRNLRQIYGTDVVIIWQPVPEIPVIPVSWRILEPHVCKKTECEFCDNGYCLGGPADCKHATIHREFFAE